MGASEMETIQILRARNKMRICCARLETLRVLKLWLISVLVVSCSSKKIIEDNDPRFNDINEEFQRVVKVDSLPSSASQNSSVTADGKKKTVLKKISDKIKNTKFMPSEKLQIKLEASKQQEANVSQTSVISEEGIDGFKDRRPMVDPFYENEKVVLAVSYFNVEAGDLTMSVGPYKMVNGRKSYAFSVQVNTNKIFSMVYRVKNTAETLVDFENLVPLTYSSITNEKDKHKEVRVFFDSVKNEVTHWEKLIKGSAPEKKKKIVWSVEPFSQNFISALFYLRAYKLEPGKNYAFRVVDSGKNYVFHAEVLRREKISTVVGELNTLVVKPTFEMGDEFKPTGENLIWLTDDERKFIVQVESKIKIGSLMGKLKLIERGAPNR